MGFGPGVAHDALGIRIDGKSRVELRTDPRPLIETVGRTLAPCLGVAFIFGAGNAVVALLAGRQVGAATRLAKIDRANVVVVAVVAATSAVSEVVLAQVNASTIASGQARSARKGAYPLVTDVAAWTNRAASTAVGGVAVCIDTRIAAIGQGAIASRLASTLTADRLYGGSTTASAGVFQAANGAAATAIVGIAEDVDAHPAAGCFSLGALSRADPFVAGLTIGAEIVASAAVLHVAVRVDAASVAFGLARGAAVDATAG